MKNARLTRRAPASGRKTVQACKKLGQTMSGKRHPVLEGQADEALRDAHPGFQSRQGDVEYA